MRKITRRDLDRQAHVVADLTAAWFRAYGTAEDQDRLFDRLEDEVVLYRRLRLCYIDGSKVDRLTELTRGGK